MERLALSRRLNDALTNDKVAESLAIIPLKRVLFHQRLQDSKDLFLWYRGAIQLVQPLAVVSTTEIEIVVTVGLTDKTDL